MVADEERDEIGRTDAARRGAEPDDAASEVDPMTNPVVADLSLRSMLALAIAVVILLSIMLVIGIRISRF